MQIVLKRNLLNILSSGSYFRNPYSEVSFKSISLAYYSNCDEQSPPLFTDLTTLPTSPFQVQTLASPTLDSSPRIIGATNAVLTISFTPTFVTTKGYVELIFPAWYSVNGVDSNTPMIQVSSASSDCVTPNSNLVIDDCGIVGSNTLNYTISAFTGGQVDLQIKNFKNPINRNDKSGFQILHKDQDGFIISLSSNNLKLQNNMDTAANIATPQFQFGNNQVTTFTALNISLTYPIPTELNCFIEITFPSDITIDQGKISGYQGTGFFNNDDTTTPFTLQNSYVSWSGQVVRIEACKSASKIQTTQNVGPQGSITIIDVQVPNQVKTTNPFSIQTFQNDSYANSALLASGSFSIPDTSISPGSITMTSFLPSTTLNQEVQKTNAEYIITFTPLHQLFSASKIIISPPAQITTTSCTYISGNAVITGSPSCSISANGWEVINLFNASNYQGNQLIQLTLGHGTNPNSRQSAGSWSVTTYNEIASQFYKVDEGQSSTSFETTPGSITFQSITSSTTTTGDRSAIYTMLFDTQHNIPTRGLVEVIMPSEISLASVGTCQYQDQSTFLTTSTCQQITGGIRIEIITAHQVADNPLKLVLGSFVNPRTFQTTGSFTLKTYDSLLQEIDSGNGFNLQMDTMGTLSSVDVQSSSNQNGISSTYSISITSTLITIENLDIFQITFPSEIPLAYQACWPASNFGSIACSPSGQTLSVVISSLTQNTGTFSFSVNFAKNPFSTRPSSSFSGMKIMNNNGFDIMQYTGTVTITNTVPGKITSPTLAQSSFLPNATSNYVIAFTPKNAISTTGSIVLNYPQQIKLTTGAICIVQTDQPYTDKCTIDNSGFNIKIQGVFPTSWVQPITITLQGQNPTSNQDGLDNFYLKTYEDQSLTYIIDQLSQDDSKLFLKLECDYPCKTCISAVSRSFCSSCYDAPEPNYLQMKGVFSGVSTCQGACDSGYTSDGSYPKICVPCDQTCSTCQDTGIVGDAQRCITCSSQFNYKKFGESICRSSCPTGYYVSSEQNGDFICDQCQTPCSECFGSSTNCTQCNRRSYTNILYNGGCVRECPAKTTLVDYTCITCESPCSECSGGANLCTKCDGSSDRKFVWSQSCVSSCPPGTTTDHLNLKCLGCESGCLQCDNTNQTKCYQCDSSLFNYYGSCVKSCPEGFQVGSYKECLPLVVNPSKPDIASDNTIYIYGERKIVYVYITDENGTIKTVEVKNDTVTAIELPLIFFPHLILTSIVVTISLTGYIKDQRHTASSNIIAFLGPIEFVAYAVQGVFSYLQTTSMKLVILAFFAFGSKLLINLFTPFLYSYLVRKDLGFKAWTQNNVWKARVIVIFSSIFSFKLFRVFFINFFGYTNCKADFDNPKQVQIAIVLLSIINWVICYIPIVWADLSSLFDFDTFTWGTQLYICFIETIILCLFQTLLFLFELFKLNRMIQQEQSYFKVANATLIDSTVLEEKPEKDRDDPYLSTEMRQEIIKVVNDEKTPLKNHSKKQIQDMFGDRPCLSEIEECNSELEEDPREIHSHPLTPRTTKLYENYQNEVKGNKDFIQWNNAYNERQSWDDIPLEELNKSKAAEIQIQTTDFRDLFKYTHFRKREKWKKQFSIEERYFGNLQDDEEEDEFKIQKHDPIEFRPGITNNKFFNKNQYKDDNEIDVEDISKERLLEDQNNLNLQTLKEEYGFDIDGSQIIDDGRPILDEFGKERSDDLKKSRDHLQKGQEGWNTKESLLNQSHIKPNLDKSIDSEVNLKNLTKNQNNRIMALRNSISKDNKDGDISDQQSKESNKIKTDIVSKSFQNTLDNNTFGSKEENKVSAFNNLIELAKDQSFMHEEDKMNEDPNVSVDMVHNIKGQNPLQTEPVSRKLSETKQKDPNRVSITVFKGDKRKDSQDQSIDRDVDYDLGECEMTQSPDQYFSKVKLKKGLKKKEGSDSKRGLDNEIVRIYQNQSISAEPGKGLIHEASNGSYRGAKNNSQLSIRHGQSESIDFKSIKKNKRYDSNQKKPPMKGNFQLVSNSSDNGSIRALRFKKKMNVFAQGAINIMNEKERASVDGRKSIQSDHSSNRDYEIVEGKIEKPQQ